MTPKERMRAIWRRHRLKLLGGGLLAWALFISAIYLNTKRDQRAASAGAEELLEIGALPVT